MGDRPAGLRAGRRLRAGCFSGAGGGMPGGTRPGAARRSGLPGRLFRLRDGRAGGIAAASACKFYLSSRPSVRSSDRLFCFLSFFFFFIFFSFLFFFFFLLFFFFLFF